MTLRSVRTITRSSGSVIVGANEIVVLDGARISGAVTVSPGGGLVMTGATIGGGVHADRPSSLRMCDTTARGGSSVPALRVAGATGPVVVGEPAAGCEGNWFTGTVVLTGNESVVFGSNIASRADIDENGPGATIVKGNSVSRMYCTGDDPAPTNAGQPNGGARYGQCKDL